MRKFCWRNKSTITCNSNFVFSHLITVYNVYTKTQLALNLPGKNQNKKICTFIIWVGVEVQFTINTYGQISNQKLCHMDSSIKMTNGIKILASIIKECRLFHGIKFFFHKSLQLILLLQLHCTLMWYYLN